MKAPKHLEWIDLLRGLSALAVIVFHVRVDLWVGWNAIHAHPAAYSGLDRALSWLSLPISMFGSAVMLFFLVSGFCVHYPYAGGDRALELKTYANRRFFRIYPPYLAAVVVSALVDWAVGHYFNGRHASALTAVKSVFLLQNFPPHPGQIVANASLWSLPVESELYLVYPLFFWMLMRFGSLRAVSVTAVVSLSMLGIEFAAHLGPTWLVSGHFAAYWIIWCAGALLAEGVKRETLPEWKPWMGAALAALLAAAVAGELRKLPVDVMHLVWACFYFVLLYWGINPARPFRHRSDTARKSFAFLGLISYSLYLIHYPFFRLCGALWLAHYGVKPADLLIPFAFCLPAIPLAYLFYRSVEAPSHRFARNAGKQRQAPAAEGLPRETAALP